MIPSKLVCSLDFLCQEMNQFSVTVRFSRQTHRSQRASCLLVLGASCVVSTKFLLDYFVQGLNWTAFILHVRISQISLLGVKKRSGYRFFLHAV